MAPINWENLFTYNTLVHAAAGATGSITAMTVFYPLDTVRSRLQVEENRKSKNTLAMIKDLIKDEGSMSLYRGLGPVLTSICCSNFVYFYTFHGLRASVGSEGGHSALRDLGLAMFSGIINVLTTTPLWVVNTRLKMQGAKLTEQDKDKLKNYCYKGTIDGLFKVASTEGISALWNGTMPSLLLVSNPAVQFMIYEGLKRWATENLDKKLNSSTIFLIGASAKVVSTILTYPLQLVQSKLRYGNEELKKLSLLQMFQKIIRSGGLQGLYKGLEAKLLQTVMTAALMFVFYEKIVSFVFQLLKARKASH